MNGIQTILPEFDPLAELDLMTLDEMRQHEWYVSWSGGKDSTATIIVMHELGIPIKQIVYVRMMYDENLPATLPVMTHFVDRTASVLRGWGYDVMIVPSVRSFQQIADTLYTRSKIPGRNGHKHGVTSLARGFCHFASVKVDTIREVAKIRSDSYEMVGYCVDETERIRRLGGMRQSILVRQKISEEDAMEICRDNGMLSPLYGAGIGRDGCWFCPNSRKAEREKLRMDRPDLIALIEKDIAETDIPYPLTLNHWVEDYCNEHPEYREKIEMLKEHINGN